MTTALLDRGASVNSAGMGNGQAALFQAAEQGHDKIVRLLAARGADVNQVARWSDDSWGDAAVHIAAGNGHGDVIRALLDLGVDINVRSVILDNNGNEFEDRVALHYAVLHGHADTVKLLIERGAKLDLRDPDESGVMVNQNTALTLAVQRRFTTIVELLCAAGADKELVANGETAYLTAVRAGSVASMEALAQAGANVFASTAGGLCALELALAHAGNEIAWTALELENHTFGGPLRTGSASAFVAVIDVLRADGGSAAERAEVIVDKRPMPATHAAAWLGLPSALTLLIKYLGLELLAGVTPLHTAIRAPLRPRQRLATAKAALALRPGWARHDSALAHALSCNDSIDLVKLILEHGADPNERDPRGATPLMRAAGSPSVDPLGLGILCAAGADTAALYTGDIGLLRGCTAVGIAVSANHTNCHAVLDALRGGGASLDAPQGAQGVPPLWLAVDRKCERAAQAILDLGAKADIAGPGGETLLSLAARRLPAIESRLRSALA